MSELSIEQLAGIRDEIGTATPPEDLELYASFDELQHPLLVSLRILKRRRAGLVGGGVQSVSIPGAVSVSLRSDVAALDRQISRLESQYEAETAVDLPGGTTSTRLHRYTGR